MIICDPVLYGTKELQYYLLATLHSYNMLYDLEYEDLISFSKLYFVIMCLFLDTHFTKKDSSYIQIQFGIYKTTYTKHLALHCVEVARAQRVAI